MTKEVTNFLFSKNTDNFLFGEDLVTMLLNLLLTYFPNDCNKLVLHLGKTFQLSLMFMNIKVKHLSGAYLWDRHHALPTNIQLDWKGLPGINTLTYYEFIYYGSKNIYNLVSGPNVLKQYTVLQFIKS